MKSGLRETQVNELLYQAIEPSEAVSRSTNRQYALPKTRI
jgi:hypothetical protein